MRFTIEPTRTGDRLAVTDLAPLEATLIMRAVGMRDDLN